MSFHRSRTVTTRKKHYCFACLKDIPAGTRCEYFACTGYGEELCAGYLHLECSAVMNSAEGKQYTNDGLFQEGFLAKGDRDG